MLFSLLLLLAINCISCSRKCTFVACHCYCCQHVCCLPLTTTRNDLRICILQPPQLALKAFLLGNQKTGRCWCERRLISQMNLPALLLEQLLVSWTHVLHRRQLTHILSWQAGGLICGDTSVLRRNGKWIWVYARGDVDEMFISGCAEGNQSFSVVLIRMWMQF